MYEAVLRYKDTKEVTHMKLTNYTLLITLVTLLFVASPALAHIFIDDQGDVVVLQGQVLSSGSGSGGDDSSGSGSGGDDSSGSGSGEGEESSNESDDERDSDDDSSGSGSSSSEVEDEDETEVEDEDENELETETKSGSTTEVRDDEVRTEVYLQDGTRVRTRVEDNRTRTDVYQGGIKVRLERVGDRFRIKVENELGEETELGEDEIISIDERADRNQIQIRTFDSTEDQLRNRAIIQRLNTQALTDLPLSVDLATNELTVTTPAGERTVTVLPDQAVQNMLAANVIDRIGGEALIDLIRRGGIDTLDQVITLSELDGTPVYEISGVKDRRLLGFLPVTTEVTITVSAETGEIIDTDRSLSDTIVTLFSIAS